MGKSLCFLAALLLAAIFSLPLHAQSVTLTGTVKNAGTGENVPAASVTVKGSTQGAFTDQNGAFRITVPGLPVVLVISSIGYETQELSVESAATPIQVSFVPSSSLGQEVVVSATRTPQRILESPVTVERVSAAAIRNAPAATYYDVVGNVKGVDLTTSSLTFKTPSTRGFNGSGNLRLNQIVDGMDNQAPGLNFSVGSVIGLTELDVESMELLPGASSALYGPGGMNGTLLINSKNPFRYQGFSFQAKQGIMHVDGKYRKPSPFTNWNLRWAKNFNDKFAFKIGSELINARDWVAGDNRNYLRLGTSGNIIGGNRLTDPNYDGVNVYGDETTADIRQVLQGVAAQAPFLAPYINSISGQPINVSRTGYEERDIIDPATINFKLSGAAHYRITSALEAVVAGYWGTGNTVYTGSDRYSLKDLKVGQYKVELNHTNWFLRAYTTQENAGQSFNATVTTRLLNEAWKPSPGATGWFAQYGQAFLAQKLAGATDYDAHNNARAVADQGRPAAGTRQFQTLFDQIRKKPISEGGGLFVDKTDLYNVEGQYNLNSLTGGFADVLVGGNYKRYVLNSEGTLFADSTGTIGINEVGAYIQASKPLFDERVRLTVSGRYDKNQNFKGRFTPRATALVKLSQNNNLRISIQTAYRFPSTQQQWINLDVSGNVKLIGGVQELKDFYNFSTNPVYTLASAQANDPKAANFSPLRPESVTSYEVGYKGLTAGDKLLVDIYGYYGQYTDFIVRTLGIQSRTGNISDLASGQIFSVPVNTESKVKTYGYGFSLDYRLPRGFVVGGNVSSDVLEDVPAGFVAFFNAPKYRSNVYFGNSALGKDKRLGFNVTWRWQDTYFYEADFISGNVPAFHTVDAQVSYKVPQINAVFKLGANNLLNQYYRTAAGNPSVGGLYYVSYGYNIF
ncbi:MAG TPA: TonB-dependent receptor [Chitinophagaceae bacterium]|nr:TonB-dependent receptor [Chitinophagaceae bacterium]